LPTATDANGAFAINVILGSTDAGIINIAANYDGDAAGTAYAAVSATKQVLAGVTAGARGDVKAVSSLVKNASGATIKIVRGAKVATAVATSDSYRITLKNIVPGQRTVKVYVNDILVKSKTVTVKR
jgi:hypothetical protein